MTQTAQFNDIPAASILERYKPRPSTLKIAQQKKTPLELLDQLVTDQDFNAAIDFIAHSLPPQGAVWWGCLCLWDFERNQATKEFERAMSLLIAWLQTPEEEKRRQLSEIEKVFARKTPVGLLAKAAFMSQGSIVPEGLAVVKAPRYMYAVLAAGAIKLLAAQSDPADFAGTSKQILRLGMEVLHGTNRWTK